MLDVYLSASCVRLPSYVLNDGSRSRSREKHINSIRNDLYLLPCLRRVIELLCTRQQANMLDAQRRGIALPARNCHDTLPQVERQ